MVSLPCRGKGIQRRQLSQCLQRRQTHGLLQQKHTKVSLRRSFSFAHTYFKVTSSCPPSHSSFRNFFNIQHTVKVGILKISLFSEYIVRLSIIVYSNQNRTILSMRSKYKFFHAVLERHYTLSVPCPRSSVSALLSFHPIPFKALLSLPTSYKNGWIFIKDQASMIQGEGLIY